MNERRSFWRKVTYIGAIVVLLIPMSLLSMPASRDGEKAQSGGKLSQLREKYSLGQASLGEIDPASETMKLATLGMRGVAVIALWEQATYYKKTENWTKFQAVLKQIARLQPNFISVWQYQAWNTSYNLSVEFDDYNERYAWVIRGINFLKDGLRYNKDEPRLLWDLGWFISQKIGRADEHVQYRRLFKEDNDFHAGSGRTGEQRDNWLVGKYWFQDTKDAVDYRGKTMKGKAPLIYRSDPAMSQINYANAIQKEGTHDDQASNAWVDADKDWEAYGKEPILTTFGFRIQLNDLKRKRDEAAEYLKELDALSAGLEKAILVERIKSLTPEELELSKMKQVDVPTEKESEFYRLQKFLKVTPLDVAQRIEKDDPKKAIEAAKLGKLWKEANERAEAIEGYRQTINFNYWEARCDFEKMPDTLQARKLLYEAGLAHKKQDLVLARELYEKAWPLWRKSLDKVPGVRDEGLIGEELVDNIARYRRVRDDLNMTDFPQDFILRDMVELYDRENLVRDVFVTPADSSDDAKKETSEPETSAEADAPDKAKAPDAEKEPKSKVNPEEGTPPEPTDEASAQKTVNETNPIETPAKQKANSENEPQNSSPPEKQPNQKGPEEGAPPEPAADKGADYHQAPLLHESILAIAV